MFVNEVGQGIQARFSASREVVADVRHEAFLRPRRDFREIRATPLVILEEPVPERPRDGTKRAALVGEEGLTVNDYATVMNLVAVHCRSITQRGSDLSENFVASKDGLCRQETEPLDRTLRAFDVVVNMGSQHLIPTAETKHRTAIGDTTSEGLIESSLAQPGEVMYGGTRPGNHHEIAIAHLFGPIQGTQHDTRLVDEGIEVGQVGGAR